MKGYVVGVGEYAGPNELELHGSYVRPGLIDGHLHIEGTMLTPGELARPVMTLSFPALSAIPSLKPTDRGLVDVDAWQLVPVHA